MAFLPDYQDQANERAKENIPPLPLNPKQTADLIEAIKADKEDSETLKNLLFNRISPGVDDSAYVKASFLNAIIHDEVNCKITKLEANEALGKILGG